MFIQYILPLLFAGTGFYLMSILLPAEGQYLLILPDTENPTDTQSASVSTNEQRTQVQQPSVNKSRTFICFCISDLTAYLFRG